MVVPTQRHKSRCHSKTLCGSTETVVISYIILRSQKNSHGWWLRRRSKVLAVSLLLHISPATTALRQPAATEECYVIITTNGHVNTRVQNREISLNVKSIIARGTHRVSIRNTSVCPLSTKFAQVPVSYEVSLFTCPAYTHFSQL
jgi:hypothetical protein